MNQIVPVQTSPSVDPPPPAVTIRRVAERASYDDVVISEILDAGLVAHVGTVRDGQPVVIPMFYVRDGDTLLLHGAPAAGVFRRTRGSASICVTVTLLDGLVLARSPFHHSMNYRSVVVIGEPRPIDETDEKMRALELFVERLVPGRQGDVRPTTEKEARATSVFRLSLATASAKVRTGPPVDDDEDYLLDMWAGVVPIRTVLGDPEADPRVNEGIDTPANVVEVVRAAAEPA